MQNLETLNYRSFPFLVTFAMTFESSRWMFKMMNRPHLNMIEVSQLISPPHSPQLTAQLTFGPHMTLKCLDDDLSHDDGDISL